MHRWKYFVGLTAVMLAAVPILGAAPAGAVLSNACSEGMAPAAAGNASGLNVACTFTTTGLGSQIVINDYPTAVWHSGAARQVNVTDTTAGVFTITSTPAAGQVGITTADINHSIEGPGIAPGSFITVVSGTTVTLDLKTVAGGGTGKTTLVANSTNRAVLDGKTTAGSGTVTSATAHFVSALDVGKRLSGGNLPDGSTIASVTNTTTAVLTCTGCVPVGFGSVTAANNLPFSIEATSAATTNRFVTDATFSGTTITSTTAKFGSSDVGLAVTGFGGTVVPAGTHITATASGGGSATVSATLTAGANKQIVIGVPNKTAPATGDVVGTLSIELTVNPALDPTGPPCAANKVSAFQIPIQWQPPGTYDTAVSSTDFSGTVLPGMSTAQLEFNTSAASFAGFLQPNVTVTGTTAVTTSYKVDYAFLPIGAGVCTGTGLAGDFHYHGISLGQAKVPTNTGPPGENTRSLKAMPQGTTKTFTGSTGTAPGAFVVVSNGNTAQPTNTNSCTLSSPIVLGWQCGF